MEQGYAGFIFYRKGKLPHVEGGSEVKTNEGETEPENRQAKVTRAQGLFFIYLN